MFFLRLQHFKKCVRPSNYDPVPLIPGSPGSHISLRISNYSKDNGIVVVCIPAHIFHRLQRCVPWTSESYFQQEVDKKHYAVLAGWTVQQSLSESRCNGKRNIRSIAAGIEFEVNEKTNKMTNKDSGDDHATSSVTPQVSTQNVAPTLNGIDLFPLPRFQVIAATGATKSEMLTRKPMKSRIFC